MDEPQPTENFFSPHEEPPADPTQMLGHAGTMPPPDYPGPQPTTEFYGTMPPPEPPYGAPQAAYPPPPGWPVPFWRRRGALIGAGVLVLVVVGLVVGIVLAIPGTPPTPTNTAAVSPSASSTAHAPGGKVGKHAARPHLAPGESLVTGSVSSVTGGQLTVTPANGGQPVTVTTDGTTRFAGGVTSITDLQQGQRVQMIVRNGTAVAIRARKTTAGG